MIYAAKLRNPILFHEAMRRAVGEWGGPCYSGLSNENHQDLYKLACSTYDKIGRDVAYAHSSMVESQRAYNWTTDNTDGTESAAKVREELHKIADRAISDYELI